MDDGELNEYFYQKDRLMEKREYGKNEPNIDEAKDIWIDLVDLHNSIHTTKYMAKRKLKSTLNNHGYCRYKSVVQTNKLIIAKDLLAK